MPTDPNPAVTPVDTTGVTGATGPLPAGTARNASNADTTVYGGGGGSNPVATATGTVETSGATGGTGTSVSTGLTGTLDSVQGGGGVRLDKDQAYRAPSGPVSASTSDTTRTDSPVSGMLLVTNKAYVKSTKVATLQIAGALPAVGTLVYVYGVDTTLDGSQVVTGSGGGAITFSTDKPPANITSVAVVGGYISTVPYSSMSGTLESLNVGAVPVTNTNVPAAPTAVSAVANANGTVTISWTPPASLAGAPTRGFLIESSRGLSHWAGAGDTSYTTDLWALEASVAVTFTVTARNDNGVGTKSAASNSVTPGNPNFSGYNPDAGNPVYGPSGNVDFNPAFSQSRTSAVLSWVVPPSKNAWSSGTLKVFNATTGAQVGSDVALTGSDTTKTVASLTYGQAYYATITFTGTDGTITSDRFAFTMALLVPAAPAAPTGAATGSGNANITFAAPSDTGGSAITGYVIQWSIDSFATVQGSQSVATASPQAVATGSAGTKKFRIAAVNALGQGAFSAASANVTVT